MSGLPAPYYQDDRVTLYCADNLAVLPALGAASCDAVLTDPPYCSGGYLEAQKNTRAQGLRGSTVTAPDFRWFAADNMSTAGLAWLLRAVMLESRRLLRDDRAAFVFTDWRMVPHLVPVIESSGLRWRNLLIWDKGNAGLGVGFKPAYEVVMEFAAGTVAYQTQDGQNLLRYPRVPNGDRDHSAQKPTPLLRAILRVVVPPGGVVLDPFAGSGSTLRAAKDLGLRAVGVELDEANCEVAARRLAQQVLPLEVA